MAGSGDAAETAASAGAQQQQPALNAERRRVFSHFEYRWMHGVTMLIRVGRLTATAECQLTQRAWKEQTQPMKTLCEFS